MIFISRGIELDLGILIFLLTYFHIILLLYFIFLYYDLLIYLYFLLLLLLYTIYFYYTFLDLFHGGIGYVFLLFFCFSLLKHSNEARNHLLSRLIEY